MNGISYTNEVFMDVPGYNGKYQVSNFGNVKSHSRKSRGKLLRHRICKGYHTVSLDGRHTLVHRIVASCFIPMEEGRPEINHKDFNPANNHVDNLEWCNRKENMSKSYEAGRFAVGEKNGKSKLSAEMVLKIRESNLSECVAMGISKPTYYDVKNKRTWRHI